MHSMNFEMEDIFEKNKVIRPELNKSIVKTKTFLQSEEKAVKSSDL